MKSTVTQYISLTVMVLLITLVVSLLPEHAGSLNSRSLEKSAAVDGISVLKSVEN